MDHNSPVVLRSAEKRLQRLDKLFANAVSGLHESLEILVSSTAFKYAARPRLLPDNAVYLFSEKGVPLYIGRSRNFRQRLGNHCRASSQANQSSFAFKLACEISSIAQTRYSGPNTRDKMMEIAAFKEAFLQAKLRLNNMQIRFVEERDAVRQALLEIYCAIALETPYNDFSTS